MAARGDRPPSDQSFAENAIILEALERDPDHVFRVLAEIAERLKVDGRYTAERSRLPPCTYAGNSAFVAA
jgi:hypothetical protein